MKTKYLFVTLALGLSLTLALLWVLGNQVPSAVAAQSVEHIKALRAPAGELHVCPSGCAYSSVQAAVDAASDGDVVKVAAGVYTDVHSRPAPPGYPYPWIDPTDVVTQVVYISKTVSLRGGYTAPDFTEPPDPEHNPTILDAHSQGHVIFITGDITPTIEGLRITGGGFDGEICLIEPGGGVYIGSTGGTVQDNRIYGNMSGGLFVEHSTIVVNGNIVTDNEACDGAGLNVIDSIATISGNLISSNSGPAFGGGIHLSGSDATLTSNSIVGNEADCGGGVYNYKSNVTLINNAVLKNHVYTGGGGGVLFNGGLSHLLHNTIALNTGGDGSGIAFHDIFGEGIYSTVFLSNTILVSHTVGITVTGGHTVTVDGILWYSTPMTVSQSVTATVTVQNQHTGAPAFAPDGYHLTAASAAIDQGVAAGITVDIDGEPRPAGTGYDLGADELWYRIDLPLVVR
jgi:hypothetical protein